MSKVSEEAAELALMELFEAFGVPAEGMADLMPVAMEGRLFLKEKKAVYTLAKPCELLNGEKLTTIALREPTAADYVDYSKGMSLKIKEGEATIDPVMMTRRTFRMVERLGDEKWGGVADRMSIRDARTLTTIGDALGFFE